MTKQEELTKTIENMITNMRESYDSKSITKDILYYLHSQGVVIHINNVTCDESGQVDCPILWALIDV